MAGLGGFAPPSAVLETASTCVRPSGYAESPATIAEATVTGLGMLLGALPDVAHMPPKPVVLSALAGASSDATSMRTVLYLRLGRLSTQNRTVGTVDNPTLRLVPRGLP